MDKIFEIGLFILLATCLSIGYGFGVKARRLPFTAELGFSDRQWQFIRWWVKLSLVAGILVPICLLVLNWQQPLARILWGSYLFTVVVQIVSERVFSRWLVQSTVVPIGFLYTAFRLWQLFDGYWRLTWSPLSLVGFGVVASFWVANLVMLSASVIPTVFVASSPSAESTDRIL
jgi:hypothetical protein